MALIGNYSVVAKSPGRFRAGNTNCDRSDYNKSGPARNAFTRFAKFNSTPSGGTGWVVAQTSGGLATFTDLIASITNTAQLNSGKNADANLTASIALSNADLAQIINMIAALSGAITTSNASVIALSNIAASVTASGSITSADLAYLAQVAIAASLSGTISLTDGQLGALVGLVASLVGSISISNANTLATALISADINSLTPLSPETLAASLWNVTASSYNTAGTMGEKLNDAGSASNPWTEVIESGYTAQEILKILLAVSAGTTTITDLGGGAATVKFKSVSGGLDRVNATMAGSERTSITLNGG
jgi:hypothetical protein